MVLPDWARLHLTAMLRHMLRETAEAIAAMDDMTVEDWRQMKADAEYGQKMRQVSAVSDDDLVPSEVVGIIEQAPQEAETTATKVDADDAVIGTKGRRIDPVLAQAAAEITALPAGARAGSVHRG